MGSIASARSASSAAKAEPTVPWPSRPTLNVAGNQVLQRLAPHRHAGLAARAEDHRRARHAVVVVGEGVAVRARGRRHDDVAPARPAPPHAPPAPLAPPPVPAPAGGAPPRARPPAEPGPGGPPGGRA